MKLTFDVSATEFATIRDILLDTLPPDCRVWVFGSRAKNTARFNSDLDLAIETSQGRALPKDTLPRLKDAFNDAPLSYRVDVLDLTEVSDDFQAIIRKQAVAFPLPESDEVPKLRFPGFKDLWEQSPISDRVTSIKSGRTKHATCGNYPAYGSTGLIGFTNVPEFSGENLLVARVGANAGQLNRASGEYGVTDNTLVVTPGDKVDLGFLEASLRLFNLNRLVFGSGQPLVTGTMLKRLKRHFPTLPEQSKIASFLEAADAKITQLSRKKALLEDYKKGCTQKIFSQDIRFKSDQGNDFPDWEERRLGEVVEIKKGQQLNRDDMIEDGKFPVINGGVSASGYTDKSNMSGDVITVSEGGNSCGYVDWQFQSFWLGGHCYALPIKQKTTHAKFVLHKLQNNQEEIMRLRVGSGLPNIQKGSLLKLSISLPHHDEQLKIADFLSAIDTKIDLVAQEIGHAQAFKKGLLQQMFV